jgi:diacylglycerol kinase family enzyme
MYYYIINPAAGNGRINKLQEKLKGALSDLGIAGEFVKSTGPSDIPRLTEIGLKKGYNTIVAIGGDGTVNEVLNNIPDEKIAFGIVPLGSTNILANSLGIYDWLQACQVLAARKTIKYSIGEISMKEEKKYFLNSVTLGLEADISKHFNLKENAASKIKKKIEILKAINDFKPEKVKFKIDNNLSGDAVCYNIKIYNESLSQLGHNFRFLIYENLSSKEKISLITSGKAKDQINEGHVSCLFGNSITISSENYLILADDLVAGKSPADISVSSKKVRVIVEAIKNNQ